MYILSIINVGIVCVCVCACRIKFICIGGAENIPVCLFVGWAVLCSAGIDGYIEVWGWLGTCFRCREEGRGNMRSIYYWGEGYYFTLR